MIYVDNSMIRWKNYKMSHLTADTSGELIKFGTEVLNLKKEWLQLQGTWREHFDVSQPKRNLAIVNGAISLNRFDYLMVVKLKKKFPLSELEMNALRKLRDITEIQHKELKFWVYSAIREIDNARI